jgi:tetratricopeptide (TPR) repeat protein
LAIVYQVSKEANDEALRLFYKAIALDPTFALAYAFAGRCFVNRKVNGWMADRESEVAEAARLARCAIEFGKDDAVALSGAASVVAYMVGDLDDAASICERALTLNTNSANSLGYERLCQGASWRADIAIKHVALAMRLSPLDPRIGPGSATLQ